MILDRLYASKRRFVFPLVRAIRVTVTGNGGEGGNARTFGTAVLAGVAGFFAAFVKGVLPFIRTIGMAVAGAGGEAGDARPFGAAVFAVTRHRGVYWAVSLMMREFRNS